MLPGARSGSPPAALPQEVVLHVGTTKTGSSSLQQFLMRNRDRLRDEGLLYPTPIGAGRHYDLGLFVKTEEEMEKTKDWRRIRSRFESVEQFRRRYRRRVLGEIAKAGTPRVLFSDEALSDAPADELRRLRAFLRDLSERVTVVVYLRRQDDLLVSRYQQAVRSGEFRRMPDWLAREPDAIYDYRTMLNTFRTVLKPEAIVVRRFERESFEEHSLYQDFLSAIGVRVKEADLTPVERQNEALGAEPVEFLRLLNLKLTSEGTPRIEINHRRLVERLWKEPAGPALSLPDDLMGRFIGRWTDANAAVARDYLGDETGQLFRSPRRPRDATTEQGLAPDRIDHYLALLGLPDDLRAPLRALAR